MAWKQDQLYRMAIATGVKDIKAINVEDRIIPFVGSTESLDRDNDIIMLNGWDLKNFKQNPVFLWMHNHFIPPLGRSIKTVKNKDTMTLDFDIKFPDEGLDPFRDNIFNLYAGGYLKATSVGFMPKQWKYGKDTDEDFNVKFEKQELWELSGVTIPSNPEAVMRQGLKITDGLVVAKDAGVIDANFLEMLEKVNGEKIPYVPEPYYLVERDDKPTPEIKDDDKTEGQYVVDLLIDDGMVTEKGDLWLVELNCHKDTQLITEVKLLEPLSAQDKAGAVLNRKNKKKLTDASAMINEVLDSAVNEEDIPDLDSDDSKATTKQQKIIEQTLDRLEDWEKETIKEFQTPNPEDGNSIVEMLGSDVEIDTMTPEQMKETANGLVREAMKDMTLDPVNIGDIIKEVTAAERNKRLGKKLN